MVQFSHRSTQHLRPERNDKFQNCYCRVNIVVKPSNEFDTSISTHNGGRVVSERLHHIHMCLCLFFAVCSSSRREIHFHFVPRSAGIFINGRPHKRIGSSISFRVLFFSWNNRRNLWCSLALSERCSTSRRPFIRFIPVLIDNHFPTEFDIFIFIFDGKIQIEI